MEKIETSISFGTDSEREVLFVGLACVDIMKVLPKYPAEDVGHSCLDCYRQRGGNASSSAIVLSLLGGHAGFLGTLADDKELDFILNDFKEHKINFHHSVILPNATCPLSFVIISQETQSRTILHTNKNLPELTLEHFQQNIKLSSEIFGWIHFEGRDNACEIAKMLRHIKEFNENMRKKQEHYKPIIISLEAEKIRFAPGLEKYEMWQLPDLMFVSKDFARSEGYNSMKDAVHEYFSRLKEGATVVCAWGDQGAAAMSSETGAVFAPAFPPDNVVDTCGAGDTFNAATIFALSRGRQLLQAITFGCKVAGAKCGMQGIKDIKLMKEELFRGTFNSQS